MVPKMFVRFLIQGASAAAQWFSLTQRKDAVKHNMRGCLIAHLSPARVFAWLLLPARPMIIELAFNCWLIA